VAAHIIEQEIKLHICQRCKRDIASGLDAKGFPTACKGCRPKRRRSGSAKGRNASARRRRRP
jgi:hypothetical protein